MRKWTKKPIEEQPNPFAKPVPEMTTKPVEGNPFDKPKSKRAWRADLAAKDKFQIDTELFKREWALTQSELAPSVWLHKEKGYTIRTAQQLVTSMGGSKAWEEERLKIQNRTLENMVKRHVDTMVEVQETHIKASKLGLARAIEMLSSNTIKTKRKVDGEFVTAEFPLRSMDLVNCMTAIEKAQVVYRRAMGLPNDEGGLQQVLARLSSLPSTTTVNIQNNNTQNNTIEVKQPEIPLQVERQLSYDDIMEIVKLKREQRNGVSKDNVVESDASGTNAGNQS